MCGIMIAACIIGIFKIEQEVQALRKELKDTEKMISLEKNDIRILEVEWSYLNQPERLKQLSRKYLSLNNIQYAQLDEIENIDSQDTFISFNFENR